MVAVEVSIIKEAGAVDQAEADLTTEIAAIIEEIGATHML